MRRSIIGLIIIAIGVYMVLDRAGLFHFEWEWFGEWRKYIIPALIIFVGLKFLIGHRNPEQVERMMEVDMSNLNEDEVVRSSVAFSGSRYNFNGRKFSGAQIKAFCGGVTIDLRGAAIAENAVIEVSTFMGGVEIIAPEDVAFHVCSNCLLGGVGNKKSYMNGHASKTIVLNASCLLGGVEIK